VLVVTFDDAFDDVFAGAFDDAFADVLDLLDVLV